jgi:hypothetical protein
MRVDIIDDLKAENPLPELLPALPIEVIRRRLDREPPVLRRRANRWRLGFRFDAVARAVGAAPFAFSFVATCVAAAIAFAVVSSLPGGSADSFSVAYAKAAIRQGEQALSASGKTVLYTEVAMTISGPRERTTHQVQRMWEGKGEWRTSSTSPQSGNGKGLTDVAFLGGITAYYVPSRHMLYVNRPRRAVSVSGVFPNPDPVELALGDVSNVEPPDTNVGAPSFADALRQLMARPGAHVTRSDGLLTVSVTRAGHYSTIVAHLGSYKPVLISFIAPGPAGTRADYIDTWRFAAYRQPLPAAAAAKAFNLLRVYPHAKLTTTHQNALHLP